MTKTRRGPAYRIETERLVIRCWSPADAPMVRQVLDESGEHLRPWIPWMKDEPKSLEDTAEWLRGQRAEFDLDSAYHYGIFDHDEKALVGEIDLFTRLGKDAREIGYWIGKQSEGKGYATEATRAMIKVAFEIDRVGRVEIHCSPENDASARIPEKLGFTHETTLSRRFKDSEGALHDSMIWTLFRNAYADTPARGVRITAYDCIGKKITS